MKELSIEEKAKRYDGNYKAYTELINRLENVKDAIKKQNYGIAMDILCKPYPDFQITTSTELAESDDEKIRKEILQIAKESEDSFYMVMTPDKRKRLIAWLEKQGSKKETLKERNICYTCEDSNGCLIPCCAKLLEKQGEQKMKTPEESLGVDSDTYNKIVDECVYGEQKPAERCDTNKEFIEAVSEKIRNMVSRFFKGDGNITSKEFAEQFAWELLTLAKYEVQKEQKPAWSEEDENILEYALDMIEWYSGKNEDKSRLVSGWLKSLKNRVQH